MPCECWEEDVLFAIMLWVVGISIQVWGAVVKMASSWQHANSEVKRGPPRVGENRRCVATEGQMGYGGDEGAYPSRISSASSE